VSERLYVRAMQKSVIYIQMRKAVRRKKEENRKVKRKNKGMVLVLCLTSTLQLV